LPPIGQTCHLPAEPDQGPREGSLVKSRSGPAAPRVRRRGSAAAKPPPSGFSGPRSGLVTVTGASLCRVGAVQGLAVAAAEQEGEPLQVAAQLGQAVGGVADELCQGVAQAGGVAGQPLAEELQQLGELGRVQVSVAELVDRAGEPLGDLPFAGDFQGAANVSLGSIDSCLVSVARSLDCLVGGGPGRVDRCLVSATFLFG
jgi:hypothetical protein